MLMMIKFKIKIRRQVQTINQKTQFAEISAKDFKETDFRPVLTVENFQSVGS